MSERNERDHAILEAAEAILAARGFDTTAREIRKDRRHWWSLEPEATPGGVQSGPIGARSGGATTMSLARAIRAGVAVAHQILDRNDLLVPVTHYKPTGEPDKFGQRQWDNGTKYQAIMEDVREVRRGLSSSGKAGADQDPARAKLTILQTVNVQRADRFDTPDGSRDVVSIRHQRDAGGTYMTEVMIS